MESSNIASDIVSVLGGSRPPAPVITNAELWAAAAVQMTIHTASPFKPRMETGAARLRDKILWASELGESCNRKLWYKFHTPGVGESLDGATKFKFSYGNIIEEMALAYAQAAGYLVQDRQYLLTESLPNGWLVRGRIDATLTDISRPEEVRRIVDVKSCSSAAFAKYSYGGTTLTHRADSFGYIQQLFFYDNNYNQLPAWDDAHSERAEFLFIDKQLGKMRSMSYSISDALDHSYRTHKGSAEFAFDMASSEPPARGYVDVPDGASGNKCLQVACSYCAFKRTCWPGLRAFKYSSGPRFLTHVARPPGVIEIPLDLEEEVPAIAAAA